MAEVVLPDEDEVVEVLAQDRLRQLEADARRKPLGRGRHPALDDRAAPPRAYAAGACSAWTPITSQPGETAFATTHVPAAPLPPPMGTTIASSRGSCSSASSVWVATPAIRWGSLPEWT